VIAVPPVACAPLQPVPGARVLRGDVDGDGRRDSVRIRRVRCRYVLAVRTRAATYRVRIVEEDVDGPPALRRLAQIDRRRGREIVAVVGNGACADIFGIFALRGRRLVRVWTPGEAFSSYACGVPFGGVDCVRGHPGYVVQWGGSMGERPLTISETFFRLVGDRFRFAGRRTRRIAYANLHELGGAFEHCG
jgi:hypothetical protein